MAAFLVALMIDMRVRSGSRAAVTTPDGAGDAAEGESGRGAQVGNPGCMKSLGTCFHVELGRVREVVPLTERGVVDAGTARRG